MDDATGGGVMEMGSIPLLNWKFSLSTILMSISERKGGDSLQHYLAKGG